MEDVLTIRTTPARIVAGIGLLALAAATGGCGKARQDDPHGSARAEGNTRRQQAACASRAAYDRLKGLIFDQAIAARAGDRANLDSLADYSVARMEDPVVTGWDPALDITRCRGRLILDIPPGAERGFAGQRHLQADIDYTAQAAADGNGLVYRLGGAQPIVASLAAFNMTSVAYRPPPAIDEARTAPPEPEPAAPLPARAVAPPPRAASSTATPDDAQPRSVPQRTPAPAAPPSPPGARGEAVVRAFYGALHTGDGAAASARIVPEKRESGAFSAGALSRFYGSLPEPIALTAIAPLAPGRYHVRYRYAAGRSRCDGAAIVTLSSADGGGLIRSIRALNGC